MFNIAGYRGPGFNAFGVYEGSNRKLLSDYLRATKAAASYRDKHGIMGHNKQAERAVNLAQAIRNRGLSFPEEA